MMKHRPITPKSVKPISGGRGIRASTMKAPKDNVGISFNEHVGIPISKTVARSSGESIGVPMYIMNKSDIEKELSKIEERFGMSPEEFYKAWKNDEVHGFQAMKFGCLYEFYRDEFE
ncbi:MAG: hypothetical protein WC556_00785 [Candidatus Methanoperedens sp.]